MINEGLGVPLEAAILHQQGFQWIVDKLNPPEYKYARYSHWDHAHCEATTNILFNEEEPELTKRLLWLRNLLCQKRTCESELLDFN